MAVLSFEPDCSQGRHVQKMYLLQTASNKRLSRGRRLMARIYEYGVYGQQLRSLEENGKTKESQRGRRRQSDRKLLETMNLLEVRTCHYCLSRKNSLRLDWSAFRMRTKWYLRHSGIGHRTSCRVVVYYTKWWCGFPRFRLGSRTTGLIFMNHALFLSMGWTISGSL